MFRCTRLNSIAFGWAFRLKVCRLLYFIHLSSHHGDLSTHSFVAVVVSFWHKFWCCINTIRLLIICKWNNNALIDGCFRKCCGWIRQCMWRRNVVYERSLKLSKLFSEVKKKDRILLRWHNKCGACFCRQFNFWGKTHGKVIEYRYNTCTCEHKIFLTSNAIFLFICDRTWARYIMHGCVCVCNFNWSLSGGFKIYTLLAEADTNNKCAVFNFKPTKKTTTNMAIFWINYSLITVFWVSVNFSLVHPPPPRHSVVHSERIFILQISVINYLIHQPQKRTESGPSVFFKPTRERMEDRESMRIVIAMKWNALTVQ